MQKQGSLGIVSIVGPGLIGGSIGLGLKERKLVRRVVGVGHRDASLEKALEMHAVDHATRDLEEGVREADIVILCTSVKLIPEIAEKILPWMKAGSVLTDVGSTKEHIVEQIRAVIRGARSPVKGVGFIGGHPLAGSEQRGIAAARPDLFQGATCILTPPKADRRDSRSRGIVKGMWEALGAKVKFLSPEGHDLIIAFISHLPQLVATSLVNTLRPGQLAFTAPGFRDVTRIASSDPALWQDILLQNREALLEAITDFQKELALVKSVLLERDSRRLFARLKRAKGRRDSL